MKASVSNKGSILIMTLWALTLLAVFTVQISLTLQGKISFLSRVERRSALRHGAEAGIFKALAVIKNEQKDNTTNNPLQRSLALFHNSGSFRGIDVGTVQADVGYNYSFGRSEQFMYGITDEERRLNLNKASRQAIEKLVLALMKLSDKDADSLAGSLIDWRQYGETEIEGFYSDDLYSNLEFPYEEKKKDYETLDEIRLIKGVTPEVFERLIDYVTVYGNGEININTASWPVLVALGFTEEQAGIIEGIRRGPDGNMGTLDDYFFPDTGTLSSKLIELQGLEGPEVEALNTLLSTISLTTRSFIFRVESTAKRPESRENNRITCVFNSNSDKIIYWHER